MCSADKPADGIGSGSESCADCDGCLFTQPGCMGGVLVRDSWAGEEWLRTRWFWLRIRWFWEGVTSVSTVDSVSGGSSTAGITVTTGGVSKFIHTGTI